MILPQVVVKIVLLYVLHAQAQHKINVKAVQLLTIYRELHVKVVVTYTIVIFIYNFSKIFSIYFIIDANSITGNCELCDTTCL